MGRRRKDAPPPSDDTRSPLQRNCANARERDRMRVLSRGFSKLKTTLPWVPPDTKLSKLDTLRLATCYIAHLRQILAEDSQNNDVITPRQTNTTPIHEDMAEEYHRNTPQTDGFNASLPVCEYVTSPLGTRNGNNDVRQNKGTQEQGHIHPVNLTWPFNFNGRYSVNMPPCDTRMTPNGITQMQPELSSQVPVHSHHGVKQEMEL